MNRKDTIKTSLIIYIGMYSALRILKGNINVNRVYWLADIIGNKQTMRFEVTKVC